MKIPVERADTGRVLGTAIILNDTVNTEPAVKPKCSDQNALHNNKNVGGLELNS